MRFLYITLGTGSLGLGLLGIILPVLPTTPFLLLTATMYSKGSPRFHRWFTGTWIYRRHLQSFIETKAMTLRRKWGLMIFTDLMLMIPMVTTQYLWLRIIILALAILKYTYFFTQVKTIPQTHA